MDPISCVGGQATPASAYLAQTAEPLRGGNVPQAGGAAAGSSMNALQMTSSVASVSQSLSQLVQSVGGTSSSEQLMRTLVAAIVLLALLDQSQRASNSMEQAAGLLAMAGLSGSSSSEPAASYSYFSYEQTTVTMTYSAATEYTQFSGSDAGASGSQLDATA
jgi:hypothetical protein